MNQDQILREQLLYLLRGGGAHLHFEDAVKDFPIARINEKTTHIPYTAWQVVEHMRIAQWDILEFSRNAAHVSPAWPEGYWPVAGATADAEDWQRSIETYLAERHDMENLVSNPANDLYAPIPHGDGQTILREALLVADHNAYHLGVLATLKRILADDSDAS